MERGIGAFLSGMTDGAMAGLKIQQMRADREDAAADRDLRRQEAESLRGYRESQLDLSRQQEARLAGADARAAEADALDLKTRQAAYDAAQKQAQRQEDLQDTFAAAASDAGQQRAKTIGSMVFQDDPAFGPARPGFGMNGGRFATRQAAEEAAGRDFTYADAYAKFAAPKIEQALLSQGMVEQAQTFRKFVADEKVREATEQVGRAFGEAEGGNWSRALGLLRDASNNDHYFGDGNAYDFSLVHDKDGKEVGAAAWKLNRQTGEMERHIFASGKELFEAVAPHVMPQSVFANVMENYGKPPVRDFTVIGQDEFGNNKYGFVDKRAGTVEPTPVGGASAGSAGPVTATGGIPLTAVTAADGTPVYVRADQFQASGDGAIATFDADGRRLPKDAERSSLTATETPASAIPPAPPGADPKAWRRVYTEQYAAMSGPGGPSQQEAAKRLGQKTGDILAGLYDEGVQASDDLASIGRLRDLLAKSPDGLAGGLTALAGKVGISLDKSAGPAQAADALVNYLVPRQRVPGSGASSDRDVQMFRAALPSIWNAPGGNALILDTLQGLAEAKRARGEIASRVMAGTMTAPEAMAAITKLPDPFAKFKAATNGRPQSAGAQPRYSDEQMAQMRAEARRRGLPVQ